MPSPRPRPILVDLRQALDIRLFLDFGKCDCGIPLFDLQSGASGHWSLQKSGAALECIGLGMGLALVAPV